MNTQVQCVITVIGRVMLSTIFLMSAVGNKIPNFNQVAGYVASEGVPAAHLMLVGAILVLLVGSLSVIVGYKARVGATLLLIFLVLATYFFHDYWAFEDAAEKAAADDSVHEEHGTDGGHAANHCERFWPNEPGRKRQVRTPKRIDPREGGNDGRQTHYR